MSFYYTQLSWKQAFVFLEVCLLNIQGQRCRSYRDHYIFKSGERSSNIRDELIGPSGHSFYILDKDPFVWKVSLEFHQARG